MEIDKDADGLIPMPRSGKPYRHGDFTADHHCLICGKDIAAASMPGITHVEMTTDRRLIPAGHELSDSGISQGCFPVGPGCAKRVPEEFHLHFKD